MRTSAGEKNVYEISSLPTKMLNNNILVRIDQKEGDGRKISKKADIIVAGAEWNEASNVVRYGTVVLMPNKLVYRNSSNGDSDGLMEWGTSIEVKEGDLVYFGIIASANAYRVEFNGDLYYLIPYSRVIARVREGIVTPINGYCLLKEVIEKTRVDGLVLEFGDKANKKRGVVTHNGVNNEFYYKSDDVDADVNIGDEVVFGGNFFGYLEDDLFAVLPKGTGYVQKCWIIGKTN